MDMQQDFFLAPDPDTDEADEDAAIGTAAPPAPLAVPCGFIDAAGRPCRRLAHEVVRMNGHPFLHRGGELLHCVAACFRSLPSDPPEDLP